MWKSVPHRPTAMTRTSTSRAPSGGRSTSRIAIRPTSCSTAARMRPPRSAQEPSAEPSSGAVRSEVIVPRRLSWGAIRGGLWQAANQPARLQRDRLFSPDLEFAVLVTLGARLHVAARDRPHVLEHARADFLD